MICIDGKLKIIGFYLIHNFSCGSISCALVEKLIFRLITNSNRFCLVEFLFSGPSFQISF